MNEVYNISYRIELQITGYVADVTRNQLSGFDPLNRPVVLADDLGNLRLILFQRFYCTLSISFLRHDDMRFIFVRYAENQRQLFRMFRNV